MSSRAARGAVLAALVGIGLAACREPAGPPLSASPAQPRPLSQKKEAAVLFPGRLEEGELAGARPASYRVDLRAGEFLHAVLEQKGVDAVATLLAPDGRQLLAVDSPNGDEGPEHLFFVSERAGSYRIAVRPLDPSRSGRFSLSRESRPATGEDRLRAAACRAVSEADLALENRSPDRYRILRLYEEAMAGWRRTGEVYQEALTETRIGKAYRFFGQEPASVRHWERALGLFQEIGNDSQGPALRNDLGVSYDRLGEGDRARDSYEEALEAARRQGNRREEAIALQNLGLLAKDAGESWRALELLQDALAVWRERGNQRDRSATLHNLGSLYLQLGLLHEARESFEEALRVDPPEKQAATRTNLGTVLFLEGDPAGARAELERALELRRQTGDRRGEAVTLDRLATFFRETGSLDRAIVQYRQALAIEEERGDHQARARTLTNLGEAFALQERFAAGLRSQNLALAALRSQPQPMAEAVILLRRAKAQRALGNPEAAWADVRGAIPKLETLRESAESDDLRMAFFGQVHEHYEFAVDLLMELHEKRPVEGFDRLALEMSEQAQARSLLDLVRNARGWRATRGLTAEEAALARLDQDLDEAERRLAELAVVKGPKAALDAEEARIRRLAQERSRLLFRAQRPPSKRGLAARPISADEMRRRLLDSETVLLVYFLGERRSFAWRVDAQGIESAVLPPRKALTTGAMRLHDLLPRSHLRGSGPQWRLTAEELSRELLGRVSRGLEGKRIVIVASGALAYVPFGLLPDPTAPGRPMIAGHEMSMTPSASVLAAIRERASSRTSPRGKVAVLADPVFGLEDPRAAPGRPGSILADAGRSAPVPPPAGGDALRSAKDLGLNGLARLPYTRREAASILALARPGERLGALGFDANLGLVTSGRLEGYRIVHFATHALIHPKYPEMSGIVLSRIDENGRPRPGFLRSYQIFTLRLPADLVALSACRTGLGLELQGEGLLGLTQSFFHAGASGVVVSLWDVADEASSHLMERFYRELLGNGRSPAAALRAAQLSMRADPKWSAPYYWAGFVLQGDSAGLR